MNVRNRRIIRKLSFKTLLASRKRNTIAIIAIAMTSMLFTSLFTLVCSINESQQAYNFRQVGGYAHGSFKEVTKDQALSIAAHPKVKAVGVRTVIGYATTGVFAKKSAEISYMDENCTTWSYAMPTTGRMPAAENEIAMDTAALQLLGIQPKLGTTVELSWDLANQDGSSVEHADTFTLVGWWDYDNIIPIHYINVSEDYVNALQDRQIASGQDAFRTDLYAMFASSLDIEGQMEQIDTDLGYTWDQRGAENNVRFGVNWGYASAQLSAGMDLQMAAAIISFVLLVILTGYLIIYNIFQISVTGDIRFYGLIKTIGVTPRQLKRIIRWQAWILCAAGIPIGLAAGYGIGMVAVPYVMSSTIMAETTTRSTSPFIFLFAALFSIGTVQLSCSRPGRIAAKVSPVEATRYTEKTLEKKKSKQTSGAKVWQMAFANLGRNRLKTCLVVFSLALSVVLFNVLAMFVGGFDMEKYLERGSCADFIVSSPDYFRFALSQDYISQDIMDEIKSETAPILFGSGYSLTGNSPQTWMSEDAWRMDMGRFISGEELEQYLALQTRKDGLVLENTQIEGLDLPLMDKLNVVEGDLEAFGSSDENVIAIAVATDDYGNVSHSSYYPAVGEKITITYTDAYEYIDIRTGAECSESTPAEYISYRILESHDVTYTICAHVVVPYSMGFRYRRVGYELVLPVEALSQDSGQSVIPLFCLFDTASKEDEMEAEAYLAGYTENNPNLMYESKDILRREFENFKSLFSILGGFLCAVIGLIGILNFFNAIMTGILSRHREFAVLQAVGMTKQQLKKMLVLEGLFYSVGSVFLALILSLVLNPLIGNLLESMFWFFRARQTVIPLIIAVPVFALFGWLVPNVTYGQSQRRSIVERLRENE